MFFAGMNKDGKDSSTMDRYFLIGQHGTHQQASPIELFQFLRQLKNNWLSTGVALWALFIWLAWAPAAVYAAEVHVAVSQSFLTPMQVICLRFSQTTHHQCKISAAATGHLYAQSMHGLLYHLFVGSSPTYVQALINAGKADNNSRAILASSRLVLWRADEKLSAENLLVYLKNNQDARVVIGDPSFVSYGYAAKEVLLNYDLWKKVQKRLIYRHSIHQVYELLKKDPSLIGFIALSQLEPLTRSKHHYWEPKLNAYEPVMHEVIMLKNRNVIPESAQALYQFMRSPEACQIFEEAGYVCRHSSPSYALASS
jgi:molybdenum ABC transporter molybdate-binding protein